MRSPCTCSSLSEVACKVSVPGNAFRALLHAALTAQAALLYMAHLLAWQGVRFAARLGKWFHACDGDDDKFDHLGIVSGQWPCTTKSLHSSPSAKLIN